jgi:hypothetical protein
LLLFGSVADEFSSDFVEYEEAEKISKIENVVKRIDNKVVASDQITEIKAAIENAKDRIDIQNIIKHNSSLIATNSEILSLIADKKQSFENASPE